MNSPLEILARLPASATVVGPLVKITCVLLAALVISVTMRRASASARHLVWLVALSSLLVLPFLAAWAPVAVRVLPAPSPIPSVATASKAPVSDAAHDTAVSPRIPSTPDSSSPAPRRSIELGALLIGIWLLGAVVLLGRLLLGARTVRRVVRDARALEQLDWKRPLFEIADRLGLKEVPQLLQSDRVKLPFASGFLRARIVLPVDSEEWSLARRGAVLIHELGHVRRRDLIGHTLSRIACALYWFHPLVWSAARRLRVESERACDDLALVLGAGPSDYAEHLLDIVTQVRGHGAPAIALAMANPNEFEGRMLAILDPGIRRRGLGRLQATGLVGSFAAVVLVLGVVSPAPKAATMLPGSMSSGPVSSAVVRRDETASLSERAPERRMDARSTTSAPEAADTAAPTAAEDVRKSTAADEPPDDENAADDPKQTHRAELLANTLRTDDVADVRRVAAWGLARYATMDVAAKELARALTSDESEAVREMAAWALSESRGNSATVNALDAAFRRDKSADVRRTAAWAAGSIGDGAMVPGLVGLLSDRDANVREVAAWSIGSCHVERAPAALVGLLSDPDAGVRLSVAWALREIEDASATDALEAAFRREQDPEVRLGLIRALGAMGDRAVGTLSRLLESNDARVREIAVTALAGGHATGPWPWPRPEPRPYP